uniref:Structural maintenance of chromosomes protein n=1 Tax=Aceria tosichella TaxID=561515 RepID=A0A6G1S406_9ACAR
MYIKQLIIQGFKSYRDQIAVEPFSPKHNVIVGRNGSGKSNFFYAIQFVLSDEHSHLSAEERQQLLHEGTPGQRTLSAYVEIVFDNSDNRLPVDEPLVALRRQFGVKKDQYYWCKRITTRSEVMNILETAGFSRSNPYYIVKQGKINQMATAPDNMRLKILKEVAGTKTFDEVKEQSQIQIRDSRERVNKSVECIKSLSEKLATLEGEKEELKECQKYDKMRRAIEFTIYNFELEESRRKQKELEDKRESSASTAERLREQLTKLSEHIKDANREVRDLRTRVGTQREEKENLQQEHANYLKEKTRLELHIKDLVDEVEGDSDSKKRAEAEMAELKTKIAERQAELNKIRPEYEEEKRKEEECARLLQLKEQKRSELYARQGRGSQFTSKAERDAWIQNELKSLKKNIADKKQQITRLKEDLQRDAKRRAELEKKIDELTKELDNNRSSIDNQNKTFYDMKKKKDALQNERSELWRQENSIQQNLSMLNDDLAKKDHTLRSMVGKTLLNGRDSVKKVLQHFKEQGGNAAKIVNGYYGMLIENLDCDKEFYTAVEMTAGNKLFHHVVERDEIGTKILQEMNRMRLPGEVTFMPLNRLQDRRIDYPNTKDAVPMISKVRYEKKVEVVMKFIFGKTLICRSLEVATSIAKGKNLDCITLGGDQVSHKGSLTGGYFDSRRSRLELHKTHATLTKEITEQKSKLEEHLKKLTDVETQINQIVSEMQKSETKNSKNKDTFDKMKADIRLLRDELSTIERSRQPKERSLMSHESSLRSMESSQESFTNEIQQDLTSQLTPADQQQVDILMDEIRKLTQENKEAFSKRMHLEAQKNKLENLLNNNLCRRRDELEAALHEISIEERQQKLESERQELNVTNMRINSLIDKITKLDDSIESNLKKLRDAQGRLEKAKKEEAEISERINDDAKDLEQISSKKSILVKKIEDCMKKIRELGTLPSDAESKYGKMNLKQLYKKLEHCNHELQKYSHVNKKALDQYLEFSERRERLIELIEQDKIDSKSIEDLIRSLEQKKYQAIQTTFQQVSQHFTEVFGRLVSNGRANLVMRTADASEDSQSSSLDSVRRTGPSGIESVVGVGIRVSFTGAAAEMRDMQQLSGGQKSIVALAFIFAIQKCDPAPFYLFDEIDQALDPQYRKSVAEMIHELSNNAQFITTTFRPELLENADKYYGVKFRDRVSHIEVVSKEEAQDFVEDDQAHT